MSKKNISFAGKMKRSLARTIKRFFKGGDNRRVLRRQKVLMLGVVGVGIGIVFMVMFGGEDESIRSRAKKETPPQKVDIQSGGGRVNPEEVWRFRQEDKTKGLKEEVQDLRTLLNDLVAQKTAQEKEANDKMALLEEQLKNTGETLQQSIEEKKKGVRGEESDVGFAPEARGGQSFGGNSLNPGMQMHAVIKSSGIQKISLVLSGGEVSEQIKTVDNTIPAGSFAKALLLAGVDASTAMNAASDPRPMLLRIVDFGSLPRRFRSDLKDCRCTASTYGDISSERVYVRLEKLTCIERETGEVVETEVAGYVAGADGRAGIRGKVVSRDAQYLGRGLISGVLGGFASMASPKQTPNLTLGLGTSTVDTPSNGDMFTSSLGKGTSQALDRLSGYYIDRAEQLQPVVQVGAGQYVDIIFTEGVSVGDTNVKREISKVRDAARLKAAKNLSSNMRGEGYGA